jgi:Fe2+ or Zn2+ uptake regulation protein
MSCISGYSLMSFSEKAAEAIRETGGRMTPQRQHIIDLLGSADERLDAETIFERVRRKDSSVSLATVYRTLGTLENVGLIRQTYISKDHERKYYEPVAGSYYITCRQCRRVHGFQSALIETLKAELETRYGLSDINICVCVDGVCANCQSALSSTN